jgi:hypothetical protein
MAVIYDFPVGIVAEKPRSLGARLAAPFVAFGRILMKIAEANSRFEQVQRLQSLSDEDLAARGLTRDGIVRHVFRDRMYI